MTKEYIEREKVIEVIKNYGKNAIDIGQSSLDPVDDIILLQGAVNMIPAADVIVPPCKVGDTVYFLLEDDFPVHKWFLSEEKITEVASEGFFTSSFTEPGIEDFGDYTAYIQIGVEVFLTKEEAETELRKRGNANG